MEEIMNSSLLVTGQQIFLPPDRPLAGNYRPRVDNYLDLDCSNAIFLYRGLYNSADPNRLVAGGIPSYSYVRMKVHMSVEISALVRTNDKLLTYYCLDRPIRNILNLAVIHS